LPTEFDSTAKPVVLSAFRLGAPRWVPWNSQFKGAGKPPVSVDTLSPHVSGSDRIAQKSGRRSSELLGEGAVRVGQRSRLADVIEEALAARKREGLSQRELARAIAARENERRRARRQRVWSEAEVRASATQWEKRLSSWRTAASTPATAELLLQAADVVASGTPRIDWLTLWEDARRASGRSRDAASVSDEPPVPVTAAVPGRRGIVASDDPSAVPVGPPSSTGENDGTGATMAPTGPVTSVAVSTLNPLPGAPVQHGPSRDAQIEAPATAGSLWRVRGLATANQPGARLTRRTAMITLTLGVGAIAGVAWDSFARPDRPPTALPSAISPVRDSSGAGRDFSTTALWTSVVDRSLGQTATGTQWATAFVSGLLDNDHLAGFRLRNNGRAEPAGSFVSVVVSGTEWQIWQVGPQQDRRAAGKFPDGFPSSTSGQLRVDVSAENVVAVTYNGRRIVVLEVAGLLPGRGIYPVIYQGSPVVHMEGMYSNVVTPTPPSS
jgi:hypothetical protein